MGQEVIRGIENIRSLIEGKKFLLVRGQSSYDRLSLKNFFDGYPHIEFSGFTPNPLYEQVCDGVALFNRECCEMIVAAGGGSAIDVAKCIKLFCGMDKKINYLKQERLDTGITLIAIPTTAGAGSESTRHAVIYYEGVKQSISHKSIIPDYAVLEPSVLRELPLYQKECTILDALSQAIESWWSVNSTVVSIGYSREAIKLIRDNWKAYVFENTDVACGAIMNAANLAGRAINITATTAAHAMSYKITSLYKLPHGHAVALCLPEVWEYMLGHTTNYVDIRGEMYLRRIFSQIAENITLDEYRDMLKNMEIGYPTASDRENEIDALVKSVNPVRLNNNPVRLDEDILREMYGRIIH